MAAAVLTSKVNISIPSPFRMAPKNVDIPPSRTPAAPSSRLDPSSSHPPSSNNPVDAQPNTFKRLRSSLEHSLWTATKSKIKPNESTANDTTMNTHSKNKGKEKGKPLDDQPAPKDKPKSGMLSKVTFRRPAGRESAPSLPPVPTLRKESTIADKDGNKGKGREAGITGFLTPSLRQASMSSPTLHLTSQTFASPYTQPFAIPAAASSSSNVAALASPPRDHGKRSPGQPPTVRDISGPLPLARRDSRTNGSASPPPPTADHRTHRPGKSLQIVVPSTHESRSSPRLMSESPGPSQTHRSKSRDLSRSPELPPPSPPPRSGYPTAKRGTSSTSHLPLPPPPASPPPPSASRSSSPPASPRPINLSRSTSSPRPIPSSYTPHLPLASPPSPSTARRPSIDSPRKQHADNPGRSSVETTRRPSGETRRPSLDPQRPLSPPSSSPRATSPQVPHRPRTVSPTSRSFSPSLSQSRNPNASTASLIAPLNPEQRELLRNASTLVIREMLKPPSHIRESSFDQTEYEEIEVRLRALARLERVWGKSGVGMSSSPNLNTVTMSSSGLSSGGEERERKHFGEALRDGYVLCQLVNKLFPGTIARVDKREDIVACNSNISKLRAACISVGVEGEDLFDRDDLIEPTPEGPTRVAKTVVALFAAWESPPPDRTKIIQGGQSANTASSPYGHGATSRATVSTPNLHRSTSPVAVPARHKRFSPPQLPVLRSDSPNESEVSSGTATAIAEPHAPTNHEDTLPPMPPPILRSPSRARPHAERTSVADSTRVNVGDSVRGSFAESFAPSMAAARQSLASTNITMDTSALSSLLEAQRSTKTNFDTIRTVSTQATSLSPSDSRSCFPPDGEVFPSSFGDEPRKRTLDNPITRPYRERHPSETAFVDLSRVEEADETDPSSKARDSPSRAGATEEPRTKVTNIRLGKGKWPEDFMDVFQSPPSSRSPLLDELEDDSLISTSLSPLSMSSPVSSPSSVSPPRKIAIAPRPGEGHDSVRQYPRRPSHRSRNSADAPGLLPKESVFRRDSSPDGSLPPTPRIMVKRHGSRSGPHRNGMYIPRNSDEDDLIPFPRSVSGEHATPPSHGIHTPPNGDASKASVSSQVSTISQERPHQPPRGRFQSEIDGASARRKPRPDSDEFGANLRRTRFESMVNLGVTSGDASASDLMQSAYDGMVRQTLVVKEDGKPATQFRLGPCIGRGQFGAVYRALNLNTGQMVAVKRIRLEGLKEEEIAQLMKEVDLVKSLSHPSIVKYEGMCRDEDTLNIVLEYAENGSLGQTIKAFGKLNERLVASYVVKILEGLHYLHQSEVVHCDLKAANILTTKNGNVKLSDFGVSLNLRAMEREMKDVAGTPNWMAPEVIELKGASTKSDIWSLGCTVVELLTGRPPYGDILNSMSVMFRIVEDDMPPLPEASSDLLRDFLSQCFNKDPSKRPDAETLFEHEWLKQNWAPHKDLRPKDSIPFLRRVSADMQKSEAIHYLARIEMPDSDKPTEKSPSPPRRQYNDSDPISPREHSFVKTTFGKPVSCRVCSQSVKRSAVLCEQCSLIAHAKCASNAPPTCDLRTQLLLYAQYAENGSATAPFHNPMEILAALSCGTPTSPNSDSGFSSRPSLDASSPSTSSGSAVPPTAFKIFAAAFGRSRSSLATNDSDPASAPSSSPPNGGLSPIRDRVLSHKRSFLRRNYTAASSKERVRPPSTISSNNSSDNRHDRGHSHTASIGSSIADRSSVASRPDTVRQSSFSIIDGDTPSMAERRDPRLSKMTAFTGVSTSGTEQDDARSELGSISGIPGEMPRQRESKGGKPTKRDGCVMQ